MKKSKPQIELELYLVRHAESQGNVPRESENISVKDLHDPTLTEKGEKQAEAVGQYLKNTDFDMIFSSALRRAVRTATKIIEQQSEKHILQILPYITEAGVNPEYETSFECINGINPTAVLAEDYSADFPLLCYTEMKDEDGLFERAEKTVGYLRSHFHNGEKIALVTHGAFMTYIAFILMGFRESVPIFDLNFKNTGITKIILYKEATNPYGDIVFDYINATPHLEGLQ